MLNRRSFTPQVQDADGQSTQVQDSDGQSNSKHFGEEFRGNLPSSSHKNQSEDDSEFTEGFDRFTDYEVHLSVVEIVYIK